MTYTSPRAFTLVETLIGAAVVTIAMVGPLYSVAQTLEQSRNARFQITAASLGQEAIEYVRSIRDENYIRTTQPDCTNGTCRNWLSSLDGTPGSIIGANCFTGACVVDPRANTVSRTITPLYINNSTRLYTQSATGGTVSPYTRTVQLQAISANEAYVTVTVVWTLKGRTYRHVVTESLFDWQ